MTTPPAEPEGAGSAAPTPFVQHRQVVAFHGTRREIGEAVLLGQRELEAQPKRWHWLGQGVYFWEHGPARAYEWARAHYGEEAYVLGAHLNLGLCLDLTDTWATDLLKEGYEALRLVREEQGKAMPRNESGVGAAPGDRLLRPLDCAVIDMLNRLNDEAAKADPGGRRPFQTVRGVFEEGEEAFPGACIRTRTHVQIAVRDMACILGYFRPL